MDSDLDKLFIQGKLSEDEYYTLAIENNQVIAIAIDEVDRITTVSLSKTKQGYLGEVLYSPETTSQDEKFLLKESSFKIAKEAFNDKIKKLEHNKKHQFDITWFK